jgi:hypothetical protein
MRCFYHGGTLRRVSLAQGRRRQAEEGFSPGKGVVAIKTIKANLPQRTQRGQLKAASQGKTLILGEGVVAITAMYFTTEENEDTEKGQIRGESQFL